MSTANKHTQGEWAYTVYNIKIVEPHVEISCPEQGRKIASTPLIEEEDIANAKLIVTAVNNHSKLIEILKDALFCMKSHDSTFMVSYHTEIYEKGTELLQSIENDKP